jgi:hypothetical protein
VFVQSSRANRRRTRQREAHCGEIGQGKPRARTERARTPTSRTRTFALHECGRWCPHPHHARSVSRRRGSCALTRHNRAAQRTEYRNDFARRARG